MDSLNNRLMKSQKIISQIKSKNKNKIKDKDEQ